MKKLSTLCLIGSVVVITSNTAAWAATCTSGVSCGTINVAANIGSTCTVSTINNLSFGVISQTNGAVTGGPYNQSATFSINCANVSSVSVGLVPANNSATPYLGGTTSGANHLPYNIYSDSARSVLWNNTSGAVSITPTNGAVATTTQTVYAQIANGAALAGTTPYADHYTDTIGIVMTYS